MTEIFLDTSFAIALSVSKDQHHGRAVELAGEMRRDAVRMVTTRAVCLEIGNALSKMAHRRAAVALLSALEKDESVEILPLSEELYRDAANLFANRLDKAWGLTDCLYFVVMEQRGVVDALTADEHFRQAGFRPLLREPSA